MKKKSGSRLYVCYLVNGERKCFSTPEKAKQYLISRKGKVKIEPCDTETLRSLQMLESQKGEW